MRIKFWTAPQAVGKSLGVTFWKRSWREWYFNVWAWGAFTCLSAGCK